MEIKTPNTFRPQPNYPVYPPYHVGLYLEDYFIDFWKNVTVDTDREFIAISWTSYYNNGCDRNILQTYLNGLNKSKKYFVVSQHDDAPYEQLPPDTLVFSAGGNATHHNKIIPIPLICSQMPLIEPKTKDIFCSFVGSNTHRIRTKLYDKYKNTFYFNQGSWQSRISSDKLNNFIEITNRSKFSLAPRGYGPTSFRLYEIMQLNSVPVYVSDKHYLPWEDDINWKDISVLISENEINDLGDILNDISEEKYNFMLENINKIYSNYFTLQKTSEQITKRLR
jgi:hypothetical protein